MSNNPYQSPVNPLPGPGEFGVPKVKPPSITVFGVLNLVFGIIGLCGLGFGIVGLALQANNAANDPILNFINENPAYQIVNKVMIGLSFITTVLLIISGIGLLQTRSYGRTTGVYYGITSLAIFAISLILQSIFLWVPLWHKLGELPPGPQRITVIIMLASGIAGALIGPIYPALVLFFMTRTNVVEALIDRD